MIINIKNDKQLEDWLSIQRNATASIKMLIRMFIQQHGFIDTQDIDYTKFSMESSINKTNQTADTNAVLISVIDKLINNNQQNSIITSNTSFDVKPVVTTQPKLINKSFESKPKTILIDDSIDTIVQTSEEDKKKKSLLSILD